MIETMRAPLLHLKSKRIVLSWLTVAILAFAIASPAAARQATKLKGVSIKTDLRGTNVGGKKEIVVTGKNGKYTTVESAILHFGVRLRAKIGNVSRKYKIYHSTVSANIPHEGGGKSVGVWNKSFLDAKNGFPREIRSDHTFTLPLERMGHLKSKAIELCNASSSSTSKAFEVRMRIILGYLVKGGLDTREVISFYVNDDEGDEKYFGERSVKTASADTNVRVVCKAITPKPYSVDLRVTQQGNSCPKKVEVRAFIKYRHPATVKFRFKVDGKLSELTQIKARKVNGKPRPGIPGSNTYYLVERIKYYKLEPGKHTFRIEVRGGQKSDVKKVKINCPPMKVKKIKLVYTQIANAQCPKQIWETVTFETNRPGNVNYEIFHQLGVVAKRGTMKATNRDGKYIAVAQRLFKSGATDTNMKARVANGAGLDQAAPAESKWVKLKVKCMDILSADLDILSVDHKKCPKTAFVRATYVTSKKGPLRDFMKCNNGKQKSGTINARKQGGKFVATRTMAVAITKRKTLKCSSRAVDFGSKSLRLAQKLFFCGDQGASGDLTVQPDPIDPGPGLKIKGDFQFVDRSTRAKCPRQIKTVINFELNQNKPVHWSLDCKSGSKSGVAQPIKKGNKYIAPAFTKIRTPQPRNGKARLVCALKAVSPGRARTYKLKARNFNCNTPVNPGGPGGLTTPGEPTQTAEEDISCRGGRVRNGRCVCGRSKIRRKLGKNRFACIKNPTQPPKDVTTDDTIICRGGKKRNNRCVCPAGTKRHKVSKFAYSCSRVDPPRISISCAGGKVRSGQCICGKGKKRTTVGRKSYRCVKPDPKISCAGGKVKGNRCICSGGKKRNKVGKNAYRCVKPVVKISCAGGKVKGNRCICSGGKKRNKVGKNAYRCVKPVVKISCAGGKVKGNRCICSGGKKRSKVGKNAYRCVKPTPKIGCVGGKVKGNQCRCGAGKKRQRIGKNAFFCVKKPKPVQCVGGHVRGGKCRCPSKKFLINGRCIKPAS